MRFALGHPADGLASDGGDEEVQIGLVYSYFTP
jgi:hypothetical protein